MLCFSILYIYYFAGEIIESLVCECILKIDLLFIVLRNSNKRRQSLRRCLQLWHLCWYAQPVCSKTRTVLQSFISITGTESPFFAPFFFLLWSKLVISHCSGEVVAFLFT